ncbi:MAG: ATP-binding protein, partial [Chlamydiia bacterium]|nr:ATP-binding protein [Chlamydiia bacterium]
MKRLYHQLIKSHLKEFRQMLFLAGPRQVGKTTTSMDLSSDVKHFFYFNWDNQIDRNTIIKGPHAVTEQMELNEIREGKTLVVFDEIHKYGKWKQFLKGFFDLFGSRCQIIVTGSAKLNIYKAGGDSLMGRYFLYRIHPLTVAEILHQNLPKQEIRPPKKILRDEMDDLLNFGGFPEPFLKKNRRFSLHWQRLRQEQLVKEDIRDGSRIQEIAQLEMLCQTLKLHIGQLLNYNTLANHINVSAPTIKRWLSVLELFYFCFHIKPWTKNVKRTLKKEPKYYLWDWSIIVDLGARVENFVALHLKKAVHFWTDYGFGEYELFFLRDKSKLEVDFLVTKNGTPWFLVEVKTSKNSGITKGLYQFQEQTGAAHAFQVVYDMD